MTTERVLLCLCTDAREHQVRRAALEDCGFEVLTAGSPADALQMMRFRRFSALLIEEDGYAEIGPFLRRLRAAAKQLPLVVLSEAPAVSGADAVIRRDDLGALCRVLDSLTPHSAAA